MRYRNIKTQAVIETACVIHGDNWERVDEKTFTKKPVKKNNKKSGE